MKNTLAELDKLCIAKLDGGLGIDVRNQSLVLKRKKKKKGFAINDD